MGNSKLNGEEGSNWRWRGKGILENLGARTPPSSAEIEEQRRGAETQRRGRRFLIPGGPCAVFWELSALQSFAPSRLRVGFILSERGPRAKPRRREGSRKTGNDEITCPSSKPRFLKHFKINYSQGPKARNRPAQGNALGKRDRKWQAPTGRNNRCGHSFI
jgi:hypothetical protein